MQGNFQVYILRLQSVVYLRLGYIHCFQACLELCFIGVFMFVFSDLVTAVCFWRSVLQAWLQLCFWFWFKKWLAISY